MIGFVSRFGPGLENFSETHLIDLLETIAGESVTSTTWAAILASPGAWNAVACGQNAHLATGYNSTAIAALTRPIVTCGYIMAGNIGISTSGAAVTAATNADVASVSPDIPAPYRGTTQSVHTIAKNWRSCAGGTTLMSRSGTPIANRVASGDALPGGGTAAGYRAYVSGLDTSITDGTSTVFWTAAMDAIYVGICSYAAALGAGSSGSTVLAGAATETDTAHSAVATVGAVILLGCAVETTTAHGVETTVDPVRIPSAHLSASEPTEAVLIHEPTGALLATEPVEELALT